MKTVIAGLTAILLVFAAAAPTLAGGGEGVNLVTVSVDCFGNPETVTVTNSASFPIEVRNVSSLEDPRGDETFSTGDKLAPGEYVTYFSGDAAAEHGDHTLTRRFIFDNDGDTDGVQVVVDPALKVFAECDEGYGVSDYDKPTGGGRPGGVRSLTPAERAIPQGMPGTGAGGMAGSGISAAAVGATTALLVEGGYTSRKRR